MRGPRGRSQVHYVGRGRQLLKFTCLQPRPITVLNMLMPLAVCGLLTLAVGLVLTIGADAGRPPPQPGPADPSEWSWIRGEVSTVAQAPQGGNASVVGFYNLWQQGNILYASDPAQHVIRSNYSGHMEVWAGKEGVAGFRNGPRGAALFRAPRGLCPDANGTLIVADSNNSCIRRVDKDGFVDTLAGQCGVPGFADGAPTSARFSEEVWDVFCSPDTCQLLVADVGNHRIRAIAKDPRDCVAPAQPPHAGHGVPRATLVLSIAVGLLAGLVIGSFATGWYIVPTEVAIATVRTAADEIAEEMATSSVSGEPVLPTTGATSSTAPRTPPVGPRRSMTHHRTHSADNLHMPLVPHSDTQPPATP